MDSIWVTKSLIQIIIKQTIIFLQLSELPVFYFFKFLQMRLAVYSPQKAFKSMGSSDLFIDQFIYIYFIFNFFPCIVCRTANCETHWRYRFLNWAVKRTSDASF